LAPASFTDKRQVEALNDTRLEFQNSNDRESADLETGILDSLERPGGMATAALASNLDRIKSKCEICFGVVQWKAPQG
jgi:hypothetical protein